MPKKKLKVQEGVSIPTDTEEELREEIGNEDLLCTICHTLVVGATQSPCCGNLFCRECLRTWIDIHSTCPSCRDIILPGALHADYRAERLSASHNRRCCKCSFVGNRLCMAAHNTICGKTSEQVGKERDILQYKLDEMKTKLEGKQRRMKKKMYCIIEELEASLFLKSELATDLENELQSIKLGKFYNCDVAMKFTLEDDGYSPLTFNFAFDGRRKLEIELTNYNVSCFLHDIAEDEEDEKHDKNIAKACILSIISQTTKKKEHTIGTPIEVDNGVFVVKSNWMTADELQRYVGEDGKFILGVDLKGDISHLNIR